MGVVSACLPSLRPLFSILFHGRVNTIKGNRASKSSGMEPGCVSTAFPWRNRVQQDDDGHFQRLTDASDAGEVFKSKQQPAHECTVHGGKTNSDAGEEVSMEEISLPAGSIAVTQEVVVISSDWIDYNYKVF